MPEDLGAMEFWLDGLPFVVLAGSIDTGAMAYWSDGLPYVVLLSPAAGGNMAIISDYYERLRRAD